MMADDKEVIDAEIVDEKDKKQDDKAQDKKESSFGKWWKGVKKGASDAMLEAHIESAWNKAHRSFSITKFSTSLINGAYNAYGEIEGDVLTIFGTEEIKPFSVVIDDKSKKAYYITKVEPTSVNISYDGKNYQRDGQKLTLDSNVDEVRVIKADGRYFLYKGE